MRTRIVVADHTQARFYDADDPASALRLVETLTDTAGRLRDQDLTSDRPGRVFDHAAPTGARRGGVGHHGTGGERHAHKHEAVLFAHRIAADLEKGRTGKHFDAVVLVAEPGFLGLLRSALPKEVSSLVRTTVAKDLVHQGEDALRAHLPAEAYRPMRTP